MNNDYPGVTRRKFSPEEVNVPSCLPDLPETRKELAEYYESANRYINIVPTLLDWAEINASHTFHKVTNYYSCR